MHMKNKGQAQTQLCVALTTFLVVIVTENVYNIIVFFANSTNENCNDVTNIWWLNQAIWFLSRGSNTVLWVYPFMIMWIVKIKKDRTKVDKKQSESKTDMTVRTSLTEFEDDSDSEGDILVQDESYKQEGGMFNSKDTFLLAATEPVARESETTWSQNRTSQRNKTNDSMYNPSRANSNSDLLTARSGSEL